MRYLRFGDAGSERPAVSGDDGVWRDLSPIVTDVGSAQLAKLASLTESDIAALPPIDISNARIGACIARPGKILCVGLNYRDHAEETGLPIPAEPILFMKATTSMCGPNDDVVLPPGATKGDWEVELGVVIGRRASYVAEADALDHVFGYCIVNDVSERAFQLERGGQWVKGKSADTFAPTGPWLVSAADVTDPQKLGLWCAIDGERVQDSSTDQMIFGVAEVIAYASRFMTLEPGDIIATGTPAGVGLGMKPPRFLVPGNVMTLGVEGLGEQRQRVTAFDAASR